MGVGTWLSVTCAIWSLLYQQPLAADILKNNGFSSCLDNSDIKVEKLNLEFSRDSNTFVFDAAGTSAREQRVTASLVIKAYGQEFTQDFDPCDKKNHVKQMCPSRSCNSTFLARL